MGVACPTQGGGGTMGGGMGVVSAIDSARKFTYKYGKHFVFPKGRGDLKHIQPTLCSQNGAPVKSKQILPPVFDVRLHVVLVANRESKYLTMEQLCSILELCLYGCSMLVGCETGCESAIASQGLPSCLANLEPLLGQYSKPCNRQKKTCIAFNL